MSDQLDQVSVEGEVAEQTTEQETSAPSYLTREEAESLFQKKVDEALTRQVGLYTKGTEKLRQRLEQLEEHIAFQKESGVNVSDADIERMRNKIITKSLMDEPQPEKAAAQQPKQEGLSPKAINDIGNRMLKSMGVDFKDSDPELKKIKMNGTPEEYLSTLAIAAEAWKERTSNKPDPETRIPGIVSGNASVKNLKADYDKEIKAAHADPINGLERVRQVRRKYRELGLPI